MSQRIEKKNQISTYNKYQLKNGNSLVVKSSTTGIATNLLNRRFLGMDIEKEFLELSKCRKEEITDPKIFKLYQSKIRGFNTKGNFN